MSRSPSRARPGRTIWSLLLLLLLAAGAAAYLLRPKPPQYITYGDHQVLLLEDVAPSTLDPQSFHLDENGWMAYSDGQLTALTGIDVSSHQGEIDWQQVAAAGVRFAVIRAGYRGYGEEGTLVTDSRFDENISGALAAGLDVGVYFFSQAVTVEEAREELALVLELIAPYAVTYPVVFDWERMPAERNARTRDVTGEELTDMAAAFCRGAEEAGYTPAVYANQNLAYLTLDLSQLKDWPFWLAQYSSVPTFYYRYDIWQYSHTGSVPGVSTNVDLDLAFRDLAAAD